MLRIFANIPLNANGDFPHPNIFNVLWYIFVYIIPDKLLCFNNFFEKNHTKDYTKKSYTYTYIKFIVGKLCIQTAYNQKDINLK